MTSGEEDFTLRSSAYIDHRKIKGLVLKDPTVALSVPISIENPALAYDEARDTFKVDLKDATGVTLIVSLEDNWERILGKIDLQKVLGADLGHTNPVIARLSDGSDFIDPRDVSDRAARLLGRIYGSEGAQIQQRSATWDLLTQLRHNGVEIDPRSIRDLTSTDIVTVYGSLNALQQRATTKELLVQLRHQGAEIDPTQIRALTSSDQITVVQPTAANLKATVTQAEKDRTITDITKTATRKQVSITWAAAGNQTAWDPASGKKVRLKLLCLELSADVDLGYRWGDAGTIYYLRTTAGPIVMNLVGCNDEGAADENLVLNASGACVVKGHLVGEEL